MTSVSYLAAILLAAGGTGAADHRWRLFLFADPRRAATVVAAGVGYFLLWDVAAIALGFYARGESPGMTGLQIAPELPLEELFFVAFLCYFTMVAHESAYAVLRRGRRGRRGARTSR